MSRFALWLLLLLCSFAVAAKPEAEPIGLDASRFAEQRQLIEAELQGGEKYREITPEQKVEVRKALDTMGAVLESGRSVDRLNENERMTLFNAQEQVNTILTNAAADSRLICTRERPVGTRLPIVQCKTVAERRTARERSQDALRESQGGGMSEPLN